MIVPEFPTKEKLTWAIIDGIAKSLGANPKDIDVSIDMERGIVDIHLTISFVTFAFDFIISKERYKIKERVFYISFLTW